MCELDNCLNNDEEKPVLENQQRRAFLAGAISLPLATILAYPELAKAAAGKTENLVIDKATKTMGALAVPKGNGKHPVVVLIHEWWGLNDQIKTVATEFANLGYLAFAIDMYGGKVATNSAGAIKLVRSIDEKKGTQQLDKAINQLRNHPRSNGKLGTIGWCFGGGWSLNASIATPVDATVIYYGRVTRKAEELKNLQGPILGHFGTEDRSINKEMVDGFEAELKKAKKDKQATIHWYQANHAFANPTSARYDKADASLAWQRTLDFYKKHL